MMSNKDGTSHISDIVTKLRLAVTKIIIGAAFGSALTLSGVYAPSVIGSQMQLRNFHMLQTFLTASAISIIVAQYGAKIGHCLPQTRIPHTFCRLPLYSGNLIGGLLIGTSMAITGACPGTVLVQGALGSLSGLKIGIGGVLGGILFVKLAPLLHHTSGAINGGSKSPACGADTASDSSLRQLEQYTLPGKLGLKIHTVVLAYETLCISMIALAAKILPNDPTSINPILGGLAIGAAQALSVLLSRQTIGVSAAYQQVGRDFWSIVLPGSNAKPSSRSAIWFAIGIIVGARTLASQAPMFMNSIEMQQVGTVSSVVGGATMIFGAALAGGCTSGHGISGMATLSVASFVTVAAMFGGGILWKTVIG